MRFKLIAWGGLLLLAGCDTTALEVNERDLLNEIPTHLCGDTSDRGDTGGLEESLTLCPRPELPHLDAIHQGARWRISPPESGEIAIALTSGVDDPPAESWRESTGDSIEVTFATLGLSTLSARLSARPSTRDPDVTCPPLTYRHTYEVVLDYTQASLSGDATPIAADDPRILSWAVAVEEVNLGLGLSPSVNPNVDPDPNSDQDLGGTRDPSAALGPAEGNVLSVFSLGRGGAITLRFDPPIANGSGADLAVFENSFNETFLELASIEVSSDGVTFVPLPHAYLGDEPLGPFGEHEPMLISGLAGREPVGVGAPLDLMTLAWAPEVQSGALDLYSVRYVRVVDIVGDGSTRDTFGQAIYDPYPTEGSAGFDLDAVAVLHDADETVCISDL